MWNWIKDAEAFSKMAAGVQSLVTAAGIIIGGAWILYTFRTLQTANKARAELAELEQRAIREPVLAIEMTPKVVPGPLPDHADIAISVLIRNDGKRTVEWGPPRLIYAKLLLKSGQMAPDGAPAEMYGISASDCGEPDRSSRVLRSGQSRTVAFLTSVSDPGEYLFEFRAVYHGVDLESGTVVASNDPEIEAWQQMIVSVPPQKGIPSTSE